jgi:hypothetical protein
MGLDPPAGIEGNSADIADLDPNELRMKQFVDRSQQWNEGLQYVERRASFYRHRPPVQNEELLGNLQFVLSSGHPEFDARLGKPFIAVASCLLIRGTSANRTFAVRHSVWLKPGCEAEECFGPIQALTLHLCLGINFVVRRPFSIW